MAITPPAPDDPFATTAPSGAAAAATPVPAAPGPRRERWPVPLLVVATVAGIVLGLSLMEPPQEAVTATSASGDGGAVQAPLEPLGDGGSLVEPQNLRAALEASSEEAAATQLVDLRVSPENVQATWQVDATTQRRTYADRSGRVERVGPDSPSREPAFALARVPADAPARIARRAAALAGTPAADMSYLLLDVEGRRWVAYLTQEVDVRVRLNPIFARLDGRGVKANGEGAR